MVDGGLLICICVHLLLTAVVYITVYRQAGKLQAAAEAGIVFLLPVAGFFVVCVARLLNSLDFLHKKDTDPHLYINKNDIFTNLIDYDENVIPLLDTFLVDNAQVKRKFFLDAVRQNVLDNPKILRMATYDRDREIAYYTVSMLSGHIEELTGRMAELQAQLRRRGDDLELVREYAELLSEYLQQDYVDALTKRERRQVYIGLLDRLLLEEPDNIKYWQEKINQEIIREGYEAAGEACRNFQRAFPDREEPYIAYIKLYFAMREPDLLQGKLAEMKASRARLSPEALGVLRYWGGAFRNGL